MSKRFPRARVDVTYSVEALHTLPESKHPESREPHSHTWLIIFSYHHERNGPFTWDRAELHRRFMPIIEQMRGVNLTDLIGESASDEVIATWVLQQTPGWIDQVTVSRLTAMSEPSIKVESTVRRNDLT